MNPALRLKILLQTGRFSFACTLTSTKFSFQGIAYLVKISEGDLRKAITFLQSATRLTGGKEVMGDVITDIAGVSKSYLATPGSPFHSRDLVRFFGPSFQVIPATTIDGIFTACQSGSFDKLEAVVKVMNL